MWQRHFYIVGFLFFSLWIGGHVIPSWIEWRPTYPLQDLPKYPLDSLAFSGTTEKDSITYLQNLQDALSPQKITPARRKKPTTWEMDKGTPLAVHILHFSRFAQKERCRISHVFDQKSYVDAQFQCPKAPLDTIRFIHSKQFAQNNSRLALVLRVRKFSVEELHLLQQLKIPLTFLVDPHKADPSVLYDMDKVKTRDILLEFPLEPKEYPYLNPGKHTLLIHHNTDHIESVISEGVRKIPEAIGAIGTFGSQAVEHKKFMESIFYALDRNGLSWVQTHFSGKEKVSQTCQDENIPCFPARYRKEVQDNTIEKAIYMARKKGRYMIIVPLNKNILQQILRAKTSAELQGTAFVRASEHLGDS